MNRFVLFEQEHQTFQVPSGEIQLEHLLRSDMWLVASKEPHQLCPYNLIWLLWVSASEGCCDALCISTFVVFLSYYVSHYQIPVDLEYLCGKSLPSNTTCCVVINCCCWRKQQEESSSNLSYWNRVSAGLTSDLWRKWNERCWQYLDIGIYWN